MKIKVGKYALQSDAFSFWITEDYEVLNEKTGRRNKRERKVGGYSTNYKNLMRSFCEHKHRAAEAETVKELVKALEQTYEDMIALNDAAVKNDFKVLKKIAREKGI